MAETTKRLSTSLAELYSQRAAEKRYEREKEEQQREYERAMAEQAAVQAAAQAAAQREQNQGGFLGGIGYAFEKIGLGFLSGIEGIWDYAAGGLAKLFGADDWAEQQIANDWVNYNHADEWFNPSEGWQFVGDVAGGIGTSLPAIAGVAAAGAITVASGGTLSPVAATLIAGSIAGLGAAGRATKEAYDQTGELTGKEFGYGALVGVTEGAIEGVSSAIGAGTGAVVKSISKSFGKEVAKSATRNTLLKGVVKGFAGEAFEEGVQAILEPVYKRMTYDPNAKNASFQEVAYAALVGGLSGAIMGGGDVAVRNIRGTARGNTLVNEGKAGDVITTAEQMSSYQTENQTDYETFQVVQNTLNELKTSLQKTGGEVRTVRQKMLLGVLEQANTSAAFEPIVAASAENIYNNAETVAARLNELGYQDQDGKPIQITAEQIREGIDTTDAKSFRKTMSRALKTNSALRTLAVADTVGQISMDTARFRDATLAGQQLSTQADLNRFVEQATDAERQAVADRLGIENWETLTNEQFHDKITEFVANGGVQEYQQERGYVRDAQAIAPESARKHLPRMVNLRNDGTYRYTQGGTDIAITKRGDSYYVYDYESGLMSKALARSETNRVLREIHTNEQNYQNGVRQHTEAQNKLREQAAEIDTYARENISEYKNLSVAGQAAIRATIRQGRAAGVQEDFVLSCARVSARSGLRVVFSKEASFVAANGSYADGAIDLKNNRIIINPEAKSRTGESILIHELTHAIYNDTDGSLTVAEGLETMTDAEKEKIRKRYAAVGQGSALQVSDEINAHFAEQTLSNKNILERLVQKKQTLKDKILGFFRKARTDYQSDERLTGAAARLYRQYKKLFDEFSARNQRYLGVETGAAAQNQGTYALQDALQTLGDYDTTRRRHIESNENDRVSRNYDEIVDFIKSATKEMPVRRLHIGTISDSTAALVQEKTGVNIKGYDFVLASNFISHIFDSHGRVATEAPRGQTAVNYSNIENILETVIAPDDVSIVSDNTGTTLRFEKMLDGRNVAITITSTKKSTLALKSAWIINQKSGGRTPSASADTLAGTSETNGRSSTTNSISQNRKNVNSESQKGKKFALPDTDSDGGTLNAEQREFFGKSAIVDADGKLLKMYHGTAADFTVFDIAESGASNDHTSHIGFWFTPRKAIAENFAEFNSNEYRGRRARVQEVYLNIENPKIYAPTDNSERMEELRTENTRLREQLTEEYAELKETVGRLNYMLYFTEDNIFGRRGENDIGYRVDEDYYVQHMKMSPEQAKKAKSLVDAIKKNNKQFKKNETEYYRLQDDDSFLQMSDDLDEFMEWITGTHAHERGFGREHYAATNAREAAEQFRNKLIKEGYDGIWIKDTRVDDSGDQVVAFSPEQIKLVTNKRPTKDVDIRYALPELEQEAVKHFGHTYSWAETGYVLTDGSRLDFSGRHEGSNGGARYEDHRDIAQLDAYSDFQGTDAMIDFMKRGNIRIIPEIDGINLSVRPTRAQENTLADFISRRRGEVTLDIDNERGETVVSVEYPRGTHSNKVLQDIRNYFDSGATPTVSEVQRFRYALPETDSDGRKLTAQQRRYFNDTKVVDENGKLRPVYHGTLSQEVRETWNLETNSFDVIRRDFTIFKRSADDENIGFFFASDYDNAGGYGNKVYSVYLNLTNPLVIDCNNADYSEIRYDGQVKDTYDWAKWAKQKGYDGVIFKNIRDGVGYEYMQQSLDEYVAFKSNQIKLITNERPSVNRDIRYALPDIELSENIRYALPDERTLKALESGETITVYRAMQVIYGKLYPPMAARVKNADGSRELVMSSELGRWEQADERPELIRKGNKFTLDKANGSSIEAAYNPYFHTSRSPLNDQFSSAYKRDNLVIVEGEVPASELTSGYRAQHAKDAVGEIKWHSGPVSSKLPKGKERKVILSRWFKPVRIVPDSEVAQTIADILDGENIEVPYNTITPSLRKELEKRGIVINYGDKDTRYVLPETDSVGSSLSREQREFFKKSKVVDKNGRLLRVYHGSKAAPTVFSSEFISTWNAFGKGFYFTEDKNRAKGYAKDSLYECYLNIINPFVTNNRDSLDLLYGKINKTRQSISKYSDKKGVGGSEFWQICNYIDDIGGDISKIIRDLGFDGIIHDSYGTKELVVYDSNQIKLISNKAPTTDNDIRYALPETDSTGASLSREQQKFFEDSKIVDSSGHLMRVYHRSMSEFSVFDKSKIGSGTDVGVFGRGFYFSNEDFTSYGTRRYECYLNIRNPYVINGSAEAFKFKQRMADLAGKDVFNDNLTAADSERLTQELKNEGYDGVVYWDTFGAHEFVAFEPEQIKYAFNQSPTNNADIRYALDSSEDGNAQTRGNYSVGQRARFAANNTGMRVYTKAEAAEVINSIIEERLVFEDIGMQGELRGKDRQAVIDYLFQKLNTVREGYRGGVALRIADYMIEHTVLTDMYAENNGEVSEAMRKLSVLRRYMHKIDLRHIQDEIRYRFDKKNSINLVWGAKEGGISPDTLPQLLAEEGIYIDATNEAECFLQMVDMYADARSTVNSTMEKVMLLTYGDAQTIKNLRQQIVKDILKAYDQKGKKSKYARLVEKYANEIAELRKRLRESNSNNRLINSIVDQAQKMRDLKIGTFLNSTQYKSDVFKSSIEELGKIKYRGNFNIAGTRKIMANLRTWYTNENPLLAESYEQGIADMLDMVANGTKDYTRDELRMINNIMAYFINFIEKFNKIYRQGRWVDAMPEATRYIDILHRNEELKSSWFMRKVGTSYLQTFGDPMSVMRRMDRYENGFYTEIFTELRDSKINAEIAKMQLMEEYEAFLKKNKKYLAQATKKTVQYRGVEIPRMQLISLYMTLKRQHAQAGLAENGFGFWNAQDQRVRVDGFAKGITEENELRAAAVKEQERIAELLTETDKEYIAILEKGYQEAGRLKADRDIQRLGFTNATEDYYYPIRRGNIAKNVDSAEMQAEIDRISNASFNKDTVRGAKQELFIESADAVFNRHVRGVVQYAYISPAIETYNKLYNLDIAGTPNKPVSVSTESANVWKQGNDYFKKLITDIQGISPVSSEGRAVLSFIRGSYAKFQLGANPKVWVTQLSSLFAASSVLDASSIARGMTVSAKDVDTYCPLAKLRAQDNTAAMAQGVLDKVGRISNVLMAPIGKMDRFVVRRLFGACQVQVQKDGGAKIGTEANKIEAGKLLKRVILETQQNSLATERSAAMRSGNEIMRTLTMFSADSMKVIGRVIDSVGELSALRARLRTTTDAESRATLQTQIKAARKKVRKSLTALATSALFMAAIAQLFNWLYNKDKDDDETAAQQVLVDFAGNLLGGLPLVRDIYSRIVEGYSVDNYAYSALNDLLDSAVNLFDTVGSFVSGDESSSKLTARTKNLLYALGQLTGIPTRNIYNVFYGLTKRISPTTAYKIDEAFYAKNYVTDLNKAIESDDTDMIAMLTSLIFNERMGNTNMSDSVRNKFVDLYSKGYSVLPRSIGDTITYDGVDIALTEQEYNRFRSIYAQAMKDLESMINSRAFAALSDEDQAQAIKQMYDAYYYDALSDLVGVDERTTLGKLSDCIDMSKLSVAYVGLSDIESDKTANGDTISGSKKKNTIEYLLNQNLTDGERLLILAYRGYTMQDGDYKGYTAERAKRALLQYILKLNITQAEKAALAEKCGFTVRNGRIIRDF